MYVRTVKTGSGAVPVQIAEKRHGRREILEHLGSAHSEPEVALLKSAAWRKIAGDDQPELSTTGENWTLSDGAGSIDRRNVWTLQSIARRRRALAGMNRTGFGSVLFDSGGLDHDQH